MIPEAIKKGATALDRIDSILDVVEPLLEVKRPAERGYIRRQPGGRLFVTRDPKDTLLHPFGSDLEGQERYDWESVTLSGVTGEVLVGRLKDAGSSEPQPEPIAPEAPAPIPAPAANPAHVNVEPRA